MQVLSLDSSKSRNQKHRRSKRGTAVSRMHSHTSSRWKWIRDHTVSTRYLFVFVCASRCSCPVARADFRPALMDSSSCRLLGCFPGKSDVIMWKVHCSLCPYLGTYEAEILSTQPSFDGLSTQVHNAEALRRIRCLRPPSSKGL